MNRKFVAILVTILGLAVGFIWLYFLFAINNFLAIGGFLVLEIGVAFGAAEIEGKGISDAIRRNKAQKENFQALFNADGQVLELFYACGRRTSNIEAISPKKKKFGIIIYQDATAEDVVRFNNSLEEDDEKSFEEGIERQLELFMLTPLDLLQIRGKHFVVHRTLYDQLRNSYSYREFFAANRFTPFEG